MRHDIEFRHLTAGLKRGIYGPHMLAFLPALCLSAYWVGGEVLLVFSALVTPLIYALTGGFGRLSQTGGPRAMVAHDVETVAQDFLEVAQHNGQTTACFQLAIAGLDEIAKSHGESAAFDARKTIKARLATTIRDTDHVFQTGDARYAVLVAPGFRLKLDVLLDLGKRLRAAVEEPLSINGTVRYVTVCTGIASSLNFGRNATARTWLASATEALEDAVTIGPSTTRVWSDKLSRKAQSRRDLQQDAKLALDSGQIQAFFQPQISIKTGKVTGMEALARWDHPTRGLLAPAAFLDAMAQSGQMARLGKTVLSQALGALRSWDADGLAVPTVSVNFSETELRDPGLCDHVMNAMDTAGLPPQRLVIEVREAAILNQTDDIVHRNLASLADAGCRIDLDNFGSGYASIATLQHLGIRRVKIDRGLVHAIDTSEPKRKMLGAILVMMEKLDIQTLAQGVETLGEHGALRDLGCIHGQGFLFAEPGPTRTIARWLCDRRDPSDASETTHLRRVK